jgi:hypothetical protein
MMSERSRTIFTFALAPPFALGLVTIASFATVLALMFAIEVSRTADDPQESGSLWMCATSCPRSPAGDGRVPDGFARVGAMGLVMIFQGAAPRRACLSPMRRWRMWRRGCA